MLEFVSRLTFWRDHRWAPGRMSAYIDGELPARQRGRLEHHLGDCHDCRRLLAGLTRVVDALHRLHRPDAGRAGGRIAASVRLRLDEPPG